MKKRRISVLTVLLTVCAATMAQGLKDAYKDYFLIGVAVNQRNVTQQRTRPLLLPMQHGCWPARLIGNI